MPSGLSIRDRFLTWPAFERAQRQAHLFGEMMERSGADLGAAVREGRGSAFALAARRCLDCPHAGECRSWLNGASKEVAPDFCPNAAYLHRIGA
ncbi:DUF6455 family protein [Bosea sp. 2YAB26]|uniref:DUF6455 family protein n=1 Tax=Bosea sp. 2YAB26 TaxID=3237478 RepID=UPI003F9023DD